VGEAVGRLVGARRDIALTGVAALFVLYVVMRQPQSRLQDVIELLIAIAVIILVVRAPVWAAAVMIIYVPLQQTLLASLYALGAPSPLLRGAGFYKEAVITGLVLHVVLLPASRRRRATAVDRIGVAFVALVLFYFAAPAILHGSFGGQPTFTRLYAVRVNILFVVAFLALRRIPVTGPELRRLESAVLFVGAVIALGGLWEVVARGNYNHVLTHVIRQPAFVQNVLDANIQQGTVLIDGTVDGGSTFVRNGSLILDATTLGFFLVTPLLVGLRRIIAEGPRRYTVLVTTGCLVVLLATITRSAILGAGIGAVLLLSPSLRRGQRRAVGVTAVILAALLLAAPVVGSTTLTARVVGAITGTDQSSHEHTTATGHALHVALHQPLGLGLGADPASGEQQGSTNAVTAEDAYLQVSIELGWLGLVLFVGLYAGGLRELRQRSRGGPPPVAAAVLAAGVGLAVGGLFLHVWLDFQTSLTFWPLAGAACALERDRAVEASPDSPERVLVAP
jgi:hypothetical protein